MRFICFPHSLLDFGTMHHKRPHRNGMNSTRVENRGSRLFGRQTIAQISCSGVSLAICQQQLDQSGSSPSPPSRSRPRHSRRHSSSCAASSPLLHRWSLAAQWGWLHPSVCSSLTFVFSITTFPFRPISDLIISASCMFKMISTLDSFEPSRGFTATLILLI